MVTAVARSPASASRSLPRTTGSAVITGARTATPTVEVPEELIMDAANSVILELRIADSTGCISTDTVRLVLDAPSTVDILPDNPVWHRRETTYLNFVRRNVYQTTEKVKLLRRQHAFNQSPHFLVLINRLRIELGLR